MTSSPYVAEPASSWRHIEAGFTHVIRNSQTHEVVAAVADEKLANVVASMCNLRHSSEKLTRLLNGEDCRLCGHTTHVGTCSAPLLLGPFEGARLSGLCQCSGAPQ